MKEQVARGDSRELKVKMHRCRTWLAPLGTVIDFATKTYRTDSSVVKTTAPKALAALVSIQVRYHEDSRQMTVGRVCESDSFKEFDSYTITEDEGVTQRTQSMVQKFAEEYNVRLGK